MAGIAIDTAQPVTGGGAPKGYERRLVTLLTVGNGIAALDAQAVFYLMPFIVAELHINNSQVGLIGTAVLVGWSVAALLVGLASDHLGKRKPFLIAAYICFALFSGASALATAFLGLFLARLVIGLAEGPIIPIQQAMVMAESAPHRRGLNMGLVQNMGAQIVGTLAAPIALVWIAERAGWRSTFLISAVPALCIAFLIWRFLREPPALRQAVVARPPVWEGLKNVLGEYNIRMCIVVATCCVAWYFMLLTFLPLRLTKELGLSSGTMSIVIAMLGAAGALSSIFVSGLSDKIGRRPAIVMFCFLGALAPLGAVFLGPNPIIVGAAILVGGLMVGAIALVMGNVPQESVPLSHSATATAVVLCGSQLLGGLVGPAIGGVLADRYGLSAPMLLAAGLAVLGGFLALGIRETRHREPSTA